MNMSDGAKHINLRQAVKNITALPSMPVIAQKLLALKMDTDEDERKLLMLIEQDPLISAKIIGLANSAAVGSTRTVSTVKEAALLLACRQSSVELEAIVRVALETSARLGELLKLQWKDVNLTKCTGKLFDTKNGEDRVIPLSPKALEALKLLPRHIGGRVFWRWSASDSFNKTWTRACQRAEINDLRFHDLRHEAVSRLFESGNWNSMEVAAVSGHKTLAMLKRYTHLRAEDLAKKWAASKS